MSDVCSSSSSDDADLDSSELGTHEYWQSQYAKELHNLKEHDDEGEIWYGLAPIPCSCAGARPASSSLVLQSSEYGGDARLQVRVGHHANYAGFYAQGRIARDLCTGVMPEVP